MIDLAPNHKQGLGLRSAVMLAAGSAGFAAEYRGLVDFSVVGALVTHPITWRPRKAANSSQAVPTWGGVLLHTGWPNPGLSAAIKRYAGGWQRLGCPVVVHLAEESPEDLARCISRLEATAAVSAIELGFRDTVDSGLAGALISAARSDLPLLVQAPWGRGAEFAELAEHHGAQTLVLSAPPRALAEGQTDWVAGRLYGPLLQAQVLNAVYEIAPHCSLPIVAAGGVYDANSAQQLLRAGAVAVQVDGLLWTNPQAVTALSLALAAL